MLSMRRPGIWTFCFIASISVVRIAMGAYTALAGPTLLYLANNVGADVYKISIMFTSRSVGILIGSILGGVAKKAASERFNHLLSLGIGIGTLGLTDFAVPWIEEFWVLILDVVIGGLMFGYLDAGLQAVILRLWGERASRSLIQIFHLAYSVGAFISPIIANPFLAKAHSTSSAKNNCPTGSEVTTATPGVNVSTTSAMPVAFNPIGWAYIIVASMMAVGAGLLLILSFLKIEAKIIANVKETGLNSEDRPEEPIKDVFLLFLLVIGYYFCSTTTENIYYNYIFSVTQASSMTSMFWLGFGLGRGTGVVAANFVKPRTIIAASIIGSVTDMVFMVVFGEHQSWIPWVISVSHGYTTAMLYPSGVSLLSQMTNISGIYMFVCSIGNAIGSLSMLLLAGYLFDHSSPFSVMHLILAISALNGVFFSALLLAGKSRIHQAMWEEVNNDERSKLLNASISGEAEDDDILRESDISYNI